ncbi:hypothetical protein WJ05_27900 [Burkholderia vietnamiensis]|uniref:GmrSD restriction endonuclease domain-containing protein n=1 Tax=Burkholderia vietnamiensis TaxID=60552 RepID=UPI0007541837|nr:DUF262 domain-containing protein [Burkholderia vietnamiensis]KVF05623.1 hypothetical protein WJ05_27900 [Burkholderia vietnamiensis]
MSNIQDRIKPTNDTITQYLGDIQKGAYQIPTFQRDVVWEQDRVKKLWDSVYKFYPLGSILVWRTQLKLHSHRGIGGHLLPPTHDLLEYRYLLDGQQRTTSLYTSIYGGKIEGRPNFDPTVYIDLTIPLTDATDDESYRQRFLFWDEIDDRNGTYNRNSVRQDRYNQRLIVKLLDVIAVQGDVEESLDNAGYVFKSPERAQLRRISQVLTQYRLSFIELNGIEVSEVCQIFERVNQAGKDLSIFDIVVAKTYRPAGEANKVPEFYLRDLIQRFRDVDLAGSAYSDLDDLTFLQMLAACVRLHQKAIPGGKVSINNVTDPYLNELRASDIEAVWEDARSAMAQAIGFLDNTLHLTTPRLVPSRYIYMVLAGYIFRNPDFRRSLMERYFWFTVFHDQNLLPGTTKMLEHTDTLRAGDGAAFFKDGFQLDKNRLRDVEYSARSALAHAVLALYANQQPRDWRDGHSPVLTSVYYSATDKPNLHHVFPLNFIANSDLEDLELVHSMMNIAYIPQITNLNISDQNPVHYLDRYVGKSDEERVAFRAVLKEHFIPTCLLDWHQQQHLAPDALRRFVEERLNLVVSAITDKLGPSINVRIQDTWIGAALPNRNLPGFDAAS